MAGDEQPQDEQERVSVVRDDEYRWHTGAVRPHGAADHCRIAIQAALPPIIADDGDRRPTRLLIRVREGAPQTGLHAQHQGHHRQRLYQEVGDQSRP